MKKQEVSDILMVGEFVGIKNLFSYQHKKGEFIGVYIGEDSEGSIDYVDVGINWYAPHSDWNHLIRVVEKIESLDNTITVKMEQNTCFIEAQEYECMAVRETKISATWMAMVDFIKWYNKQKVK